MALEHHSTSTDYPGDSSVWAVGVCLCTRKLENPWWERAQPKGRCDATRLASVCSEVPIPERLLYELVRMYGDSVCS